MDKSHLLHSLKRDLLVGGTLSAVQSAGVEYLITKPRKTNQEILLIARDAYLVSIGESLTTDIAEFIILKCQKALTYKKRILSHISAFTLGKFAKFGIRVLLKKETDVKKELLIKLPISILLECLLFAFDNLEQTAEAIKPYSPALYENLMNFIKLKNGNVDI